MLSFSKKRFRVVGADAPVGERVTMGFTLPYLALPHVGRAVRESALDAKKYRGKVKTPRSVLKNLMTQNV